MKKSMIFGMALAMLVMSCKKEEETMVSEDEAAETVTKSMETDNSGVNEQLEESAKMAEVALVNPLCSVAQDSTIVKSYSSATRTLDYTFTWGYQVNCTNSIPSNVTFNYSSTGSYTTPRMDSDDSATGEIVLTQLVASETNYKATLDYSRNGSQISKIGNANSFTSTITVNSSNILIDKSTYRVVSGDATLAISGSSTDGTAFSYGGTITFLGNMDATITLDSGATYSVNL